MLTLFALAVPLVLLLVAWLTDVAVRGTSARRRAVRPAQQGAALAVAAGPPDAVHDVQLHADLEGPPSAFETCDRCHVAVAAAVAVYLPGGRLLLCGHHGRQYESELRLQGAIIVGDLSFRGGPALPVVRPQGGHRTGDSV